MLVHRQETVTKTCVVCEVCGHRLIEIEGPSECANLRAVRESGWAVVHVVLYEKTQCSCHIAICSKCRREPRGGFWFVDLVAKLERDQNRDD